MAANKLQTRLVSRPVLISVIFVAIFVISFVAVAFGTSIFYDTISSSLDGGLQRSERSQSHQDEQVIYIKVPDFSSQKGGQPLNDTRQYAWVAWGKQYRLKLWSDSHFIAPSFLMVEDGENRSIVQRSSSKSRCFARGSIEGTPISDAALNICDGLRGVVRIENQLFIIEPLKYYTPADSSATREDDSLRRFRRRFDHWKVNETVGLDTWPLGDQQVIEPHVIRPFKYTLPDTGGLISTEDRNSSQDNVRVSATGSGYLNSGIDTNVEIDSAERIKRFIYSKKHTIEVLVVIDHKMALYHGKQVEDYVLTLMSVVSLIFREQSIGNYMDIAVVEVVKPEGKSFTHRKSYNNNSAGESAEEMLKMFCKWQRHKKKYYADGRRRYDAAVLLTRENICRNPYTQSCDTLGLAELGTMCSRFSSCAIVQDNGLSASFTIAHELGHLLNMPHDDDDKCLLFLDPDDDTPLHMNVMSRMLDHNTLPWIWSKCSRQFLNDFIKAGHTQCLEDDPLKNALAEDKVEYTLAGEMFSASTQCQYVFGRESSICPYMPRCKRLWCTTTLDEKEGCRTQHMPWADGTPCGSGSWCLRGECVPQNKKKMRKMHGQWGAWQAWSKCSRTCGVGVKRSERFCDAPSPQYGGHFCIGERVRYESCKLSDCPSGALDFRSKQCKEFNGQHFGLPDIPENVRWVPKYSGISRKDSCKLFCQVYNNSFYYQLRDTVEDGTPCRPDSYDICVSGDCRVAGCDYVLDSTLKDDWCGVCNGDNSTCQYISGTMNDPQPWGYTDVAILPEGAARIEIYQSSYHDSPADDNYLALVDIESGDYLLNGHWIVTPFEKLVEFGGTVLQYTGSNTAIEKINSTKPLKKKLLVQVLAVGELKPPYIKYSYSKSDSHATPTYNWKLGDWTSCSKSCLGNRQRTSYCIRGDTEAKVADQYCLTANIQKPAPMKESCAASCPVKWKYSEWNDCVLDLNRQCVKKRTTKYCVTSTGSKVDRSRCIKEDAIVEMKCATHQCPAWRYSGYTPCSCPRGNYKGIKRRLYACFQNERPIIEWACSESPKPNEEKGCFCWHAGEWSSQCFMNESETVLEMKRKSELFHPAFNINNSLGGDDFYDRALRGRIIKATHLENFEEPLQCPRGKKVRKVACGPPRERKPLRMCDLSKKPATTTSCIIPCESLYKSVQSNNAEKESLFEDDYIRPSVPTYRDTSSVIMSIDEHARRKNKMRIFKGGKSGYDRVKINRNQRKNTIEDDEATVTDNDLRRYNNPFGDPSLTNKFPFHHNNQLNPKGRRRISNRFDTNNIHIIDSSEEENINLIKARVYQPDLTPKERSDWQTGAWTECSKDCGTGNKRRQVVCGGLQKYCDSHRRPSDTEICNVQLCTEWHHGNWGKCLQENAARPCKGTKRRSVTCQDSNGKDLTPPHCLVENQPKSKTNCKLPCKRRGRSGHKQFKWKKSSWSSCSEPCDRGVKTRSVVCTSKMSKMAVMDDEYCVRYGVTKPRQKRRCNVQTCPFRWIAGSWSQCSVRCGPGAQTRIVGCHKVSSLGWIDPDPIERKCKRKEPPAVKVCNLGPCNRGYFWVTRPWKPCQAPCGEAGRQRRSVICNDFKGKRVPRKRCSREHRPRRKHKCMAAPCGFTSCLKARDYMGVSLDGEYSLLVAGVNMTIYCFGMNTTHPKEYLTLPAGDEGNHAEIYNKRLLRPDTCPYNGARLDNCYCAEDDSGRAGLTMFSKIRINITSLAINSFDFVFAHAASGRLIPYGEAGDCYSMTQCPQGSFSINLVGTKLKVSDRTSWKGYGNKAAHWISRLDESQRIVGKCGGYCGTCTPDPELGLKLDIRLPTNLSKKSTK